jgi:hypothetical protein
MLKVHGKTGAVPVRANGEISNGKRAEHHLKRKKSETSPSFPHLLKKWRTGAKYGDE